MTDDQGAPGLLWPAMSRFWRLILAITAGLGLLLAVLLSTLDVASYERTSTYLVSSATAAPNEDRAVVSTNTDRAARDYATVLQQDQALLTRLGASVGRSADDVRDRVQAGYEPATSSIAVRYHGRSRAEVQALFAELNQLVAKEGIASTNFPPGAVRPLQKSSDVVTRIDPLRAHPAWGLLGGLLVGLGVAIALERAHPRIAGKGHLQSLTAHPVVSVPAGSQQAVEALTLRLLSPRPLPLTIAVAPAAPAGRQAAEDLVARIRTCAVDLADRGYLAPDAAAVTSRLTTRPAPPAAFTRAGCVLVVVPGLSATAVGRALEQVAGVRPLLVALVTEDEPADDTPADEAPPRPLAEAGSP